MPLDSGEERGQKPSAFSRALQKASYVFPPAQVGFEELLNGLPAALGVTNPSVKNKRWDKQKEDGAGRDLNLPATGRPVASLVGSARGVAEEHVFGCSDATVASTALGKALSCRLCALQAATAPPSLNPQAPQAFWEIFVLATPCPWRGSYQAIVPSAPSAAWLKSCHSHSFPPRTKALTQLVPGQLRGRGHRAEQLSPEGMQRGKTCFQ